LILAHHHPAYTVGTHHGWSKDMLAQIDKICEETGVWPHAVLSGHAHNYQRFTRVRQAMQIPYIIAGNGGHAVARLKREPEAGGPPLESASDAKKDGASRYVTPFRAPTVLQEGFGEAGKLRRPGLRISENRCHPEAIAHRISSGLGRRRGKNAR
jgi:hypothetical protein